MQNTKVISSHTGAYSFSLFHRTLIQFFSSQWNLNSCVKWSDRRWTKIPEWLVIRTVSHIGRKRELQQYHKSPLFPRRSVVEGEPTPRGGNYWTVTATVSEGAGMRTWTVYSSAWHPCCIPSKCQARRKAPGFSITQSTRHLLCWLI